MREPRIGRTWRVPSVLLMALVLTAAAGWVYSTSFAGVFVFDDKFAISDNPNIKSLWPLTRAMSAPPEMPVSGRPVASLTLAINYALAPDDVRDLLLPPAPDAPPVARGQDERRHQLGGPLHLAGGNPVRDRCRRLVVLDQPGRRANVQ